MRRRLTNRVSLRGPRITEIAAEVQRPGWLERVVDRSCLNTNRKTNPSPAVIFVSMHERPRN